MRSLKRLNFCGVIYSKHWEHLPNAKKKKKTVHRMINSTNKLDILFHCLIFFKEKEKNPHKALKTNTVLLSQNMSETWRSINEACNLVKEGFEINMKLRYKKGRPITA